MKTKFLTAIAISLAIAMLATGFASAKGPTMVITNDDTTYGFRVRNTGGPGIYQVRIKVSADVGPITTIISPDGWSSVSEPADGDQLQVTWNADTRHDKIGGKNKVRVFYATFEADPSSIQWFVNWGKKTTGSTYQVT